MENVKNIQPQVYPNPATDKLYINYNSAEEYVVEVLNSQGQSVIKENMSGNHP